MWSEYQFSELTANGTGAATLVMGMGLFDWSWHAGDGLEIVRQTVAGGFLILVLHRKYAAFVNGADDGDVFDLGGGASDWIVGEYGEVRTPAKSNDGFWRE